MGRWGKRLERQRAILNRDVGRVVDGDELAEELAPTREQPEHDARGVEESPHVRRLDIPIGVERAAAWGWRVLVIALASYVVYRILSFFSDITVPIAIAVLMTALGIPFVDALVRLRVPRVLATIVVVLAGIAVIVGILTLVGQQVIAQIDDLRTSVADGLGEIQDWLRDGPLGLSDEQLDSWIDRAQHAVQGDDGEVVQRATEFGSRLTHVAAGTFIVIFSTFFFLYEGERIWRFIVALVPRKAREAVDGSGHVAWISLTAFVRATVLVASVDAVAIAFAAWLLGVPLVFAIGMLVFLGAFVPIVGAFVSGIVAVLVALVDQGFWTAVLMLVAVLLVQQLESHVLQPFLMGRLVRVHPLAIILAIAAGITISGVVGALVAVPTAACANAVVRYLAGRYGEQADLSREPEAAAAR
ncbi:AI-2E family transporter [Solicola gregarius]|uniref:AI-2E family transporter n=1 Tax=Solicola gregarius TaxID=2908642 RepID=A0AA46TJB8_9ACTN|nr:AI-2E family transporter [Solicola gregarius]UYM06397.1 AI-2E family transporter [Solicola gregarius]